MAILPQLLTILNIINSQKQMKPAQNTKLTQTHAHIMLPLHFKRYIFVRTAQKTLNLGQALVLGAFLQMWFKCYFYTSNAV